MIERRKTISYLKIVYIIGFVLLIFVQQIISQRLNTRIADNMNEIIYVIQGMLLLCILLFYKQGFLLANILAIVNFNQTCIAFVITHNMSIGMGLIVQVVNYIMILIIMQYKRRIKIREQQLVLMANCDALTGLPNRRAFHLDLDRAVNKVRRQATSQNRFALVFIDLDNFKCINDTAGHDSGDKTLIVVAEAWQSIIRYNESLYRLGGDEFAILINDYESENSLMERISEYRNLLSDKLCLQDLDYQVSASFGVALCPNDGIDSQLLMKYADAAMYQAKRVKTTGICFYGRKPLYHVFNS